MKTPLVENNQTTSRFELETEEGKAILEYAVRGDVLLLTHTEVPEDLRGGGIGRQLVEGALQQIEAAGQKIVPLCPYVVAFLKRHPEWNRLVSE